MSVIVQTTSMDAPEGADILYRDALVSNGTLFLIDLSNKGALDTFSVSENDPIHNLAREASSEIGTGIDTEGIVHVKEISSLTAGKGFSQELGGDRDGELYQGLLFDTDINNYLASKSPHCLWIFWARIKNTSIDNDDFIRTLDSQAGDESFGNFRCNVFDNGNFVPTFAGIATAPDNEPSPGNLVQLGFEFTGVGNKVNIYMNRQLNRESSDDATGFVNAPEILVGRRAKAGPATEAAFYRTLIEDLDVSGRNAIDVFREDYDYVHAQGDYSGIDKRPFVDNY